MHIPSKIVIRVRVTVRVPRQEFAIESSTYKDLKELLHYDPETGLFTWIKSRRRPIQIGDVAGYVNAQGYVSISLYGKPHVAHRLAWLYMYGKWPRDQIDHINSIKTDNRIANLREATNAQQQQNRSKRVDNTSGHIGVYWHKRDRKWRAHLQCGKKLRQLGSFDRIEDAVAARTEAKRKYHTFNPQD